MNYITHNLRYSAACGPDNICNIPLVCLRLQDVQALINITNYKPGSRIQSSHFQIQQTSMLSSSHCSIILLSTLSIVTECLIIFDHCIQQTLFSQTSRWQICNGNNSANLYTEHSLLHSTLAKVLLPSPVTIS